jgi:hypothetical protein
MQLYGVMFQYSAKDSTEDRLDYIRQFPTAIIMDGNHPLIKRGGKTGITINSDSCHIGANSFRVTQSFKKGGYYCDSKEYYGDMAINCASIKSTGDLFHGMYKSRCKSN